MQLLKPIVDEHGNMVQIKSSYQPNEEIRLRTLNAIDWYQVAADVMDQPYREFGLREDFQLSTTTDIEGVETNNYHTVLTRLTKNRQLFNNLKPARDPDPDLSWRSNDIRPIARNKVMTIVAHLVSDILFPAVVAQNEDGEEDQDFAEVMSQVQEYVLNEMQYEDIAADALVDMCVSPYLIMEQGYAEVKRQVKSLDKDSDGNYKIEEVIDSIYSGFFGAVVPIDQLYLANMYEPNIQKQPFIVRRRYLDYESAQLKWGETKNFHFVQPGIKSMLHGEENIFYDQYDDDLEGRLVEELTVYQRSLDLELVFLNGILLHNDAERPLQRQDKFYPFAKTIFEPYGTGMFAGMSLVQKFESDAELLNKAYRMTIDGSFLRMNPSQVVYGESNVDPSAFSPRSIITFDNPNAKVETIGLQNDINAGYALMDRVESSISESSQDPRSSGLAESGQKTKFEVQLLESNAQINLSRAGRMWASMVRQFGQLTLNSIVQHMPIAEMQELLSDDSKLIYPKLILPADTVRGETDTRIVHFTEELPTGLSEEELDEAEFDKSLDLLAKKIEEGTSLSLVRPSVFRRLKYLAKVEPSLDTKQSKIARKMMLYDRLLNNPFIDQRELTRTTVVKSLAPGQEKDLMLSDGEAKDAAALLQGVTDKQPAPLNSEVFDQV